MRRTIGITAAALLALAAPALAADPGTATPPAGPPLVDVTTGEVWSRVTAQSPSVWKLTGPGKFQVGFRVNLPADAAEGPAGIVMIRHQGKPLAQFRVMPKPGKDTWKDETKMKPAVGAGFYVEVGAGEQPYEFRINGGGPHGGAVYVIDAAKSKRPLPANAPIVAMPAGAPLIASSSTPTPTPALDATATPTPATTAVAAATPEPPRVRGASNPFALWLGAGTASQTRTFVTGTAPASDLAVGVRWLPRDDVQLAFSVEYESSEDLVPLPLAPVTRVSERRLLADLGAGYRIGGAGGSIVGGATFRWGNYESDEAGYDVMFAGLAARAELPAGPLVAFVGGEAGVPVSDGVPKDWGDGDLSQRFAWFAGARYTRSSMTASPSVGLEYRGERVERRYSEFSSHGLRLVLQAEF